VGKLQDALQKEIKLIFRGAGKLLVYEALSY
jgi:hypothetical protein